MYYHFQTPLLPWQRPSLLTLTVPACVQPCPAFVQRWGLILHYDRVQCIFKKKTGQKKTDQDLIFKTRSKSKKVLSCVLYHFATPNQILRSQERPLRLQEDFLETHKRLGISKPARALKILDLSGCIQGTFIMSKTTKTPLRNHQRPLRLQGWHLDDALENPGVGALLRQV